MHYILQIIFKRYNQIFGNTYLWNIPTKNFCTGQIFYCVGLGARSLGPFIPPQSLCGLPRNIPRETWGSGQKLWRWCREVVLDCALFDQGSCVIVCCAAVESRERKRLEIGHLIWFPRVSWHDWPTSSSSGRAKLGLSAWERKLRESLETWLLHGP